MDDALHKRGQTLEERFYADKNAELLAKMRKGERDKITKQEIAAATGITDDAVLERLVNMQINVETLTALSVVPLVEIAWADGEMHDKERAAICQAARDAGMPEDGPGYQLLQQWLAKKPNLDVLAAWKDYVAALAESLDADEYALVRDNLIARAQGVAESAGGILGLGKISAIEQKKLGELRAAFK